MKRGQPWYKRDPIAALDGYQGLGPERIGAYNTLLDLIYARGGETLRDDRHLGGVLGCSTRKARALTDQLLQLGKLHFHDGFITNSRAKRDAKTTRNDDETNANGSRNGSENEGELNENNDLTIGSGATNAPLDKDKDKEKLASLDSQGKRAAEILSVRDALNPGHGFDDEAISASIDRWLNDGFELKDITAGIRTAASRDSFDGALGLNYFDGPISDAAKLRKAKEPIPPEQFTESQWAQALSTYGRTGDWPKAWGAPPGTEGCLVPAALLEPATATTH